MLEGDQEPQLARQRAMIRRPSPACPPAASGVDNSGETPHMMALTPVCVNDLHE
jgi:hypothetical protein